MRTTILVLALGFSWAAYAIVPQPSGKAVTAAPVITDLDSTTLAEGEHKEWVEDGKLNSTNVYHFADGRIVEDWASFLVTPKLIQKQWTWTETKGGKILREFAVDFDEGTARAEKAKNGGSKKWNADLPERNREMLFVHTGFTYALIHYRDRLKAGERMTLKAVGFTPKPRVVDVEVSFAGEETIKRSGENLMVDHFILHPRLPFPINAFIKPSDSHFWLTRSTPAEFRSFEGSLVEPDDPKIRVTTLPR